MRERLVPCHCPALLRAPSGPLGVIVCLSLGLIRGLGFTPVPLLISGFVPQPLCVKWVTLGQSDR